MAKFSTDELKDDLVRGWLIKSGTDLATAVKLAAAPDTAIYHCQQAAEKALKGLLAYHDQRVVRTHDVGYLVTLAVPFEESLRSAHPPPPERSGAARRLGPDGGGDRV